MQTLNGYSSTRWASLLQRVNKNHRTTTLITLNTTEDFKHYIYFTPSSTHDTSYSQEVFIYPNGRVAATCDCIAGSMNQLCKHLALVMLDLHKIPDSEPIKIERH